MNVLAAFFLLLFAHLLADYPLQGDFLANIKGKNLIALLTHAGIWTGTVTLSLKLLGYHPTFPVVVFLFVVHAIIADALKAKKLLWYRNMDAPGLGLLIDQLIHVTQIIVALVVLST